MMLNTSSVEDNSDEGGDTFIDVADMSEKRKRAETPTIMQRECVHEAIVVQEDADQGGRDDCVAVASKDKVDGTDKVTDVGRQRRPKSLRMLNV